MVGRRDRWISCWCGLLWNVEISAFAVSAMPSPPASEFLPRLLASLDPSTVATIAARVQEERVIRVRIEQDPERPLRLGTDATFDGHASDINDGR